MGFVNVSTVMIYKFHYGYIKNKYGNNSRLLFTDADSLIMKSKQMMLMKILVRTKKILILVMIQLN